MEISELICLRNRLKRMSVDTAMDDLLAGHHYICDIADDYPSDTGFEELDRLFTSNIKYTSFIITKIEERIIDLENEINMKSTSMLHSDLTYWADHGARFKTATYQREFQQLPITEFSEEMAKARIGQYTDWRYPGLEIGPGDGYWTPNLVACDPLYLVDYNEEFLESAKSQFSAKYQNRLRCYINHGSGLHMLPQNQFGFVFSWNTFNYFSVLQIRDYLQEIHKVLRPGGACMLSYNNAELPEQCRRAEDHLMSYMPKSTMMGLLTENDFIDIKTEDTDTTISWVEFRKPGILESNRTGQTLGKIILTPHVKA